MAHYAFLNDNNIVTEVIVGKDEDDNADLPEGFDSWEAWYGDYRGQTCKRTSYNTFGNSHTLDGTPYRGNYAGIGARLQKKIDKVEITEVISGGPAWRDNILEKGDAILKVRQDNEDEPVGILNMRLTEAVKLIKGKKGTKVHLTIKKVDGSISEVTVKRDIVLLEETYIKSSICLLYTSPSPRDS